MQHLLYYFVDISTNIQQLVRPKANNTFQFEVDTKFTNPKQRQKDSWAWMCVSEEADTKLWKLTLNYETGKVKP